MRHKLGFSLIIVAALAATPLNAQTKVEEGTMAVPVVGLAFSLGYLADDTSSRLVFPHAHAHKLEGRAGQTAYKIGEATFEALDGRLDTLRWTSEAASLGGARRGANRGQSQRRRPHGRRRGRGGVAHAGQTCLPLPPGTA